MELLGARTKNKWEFEEMKLPEIGPFCVDMWGIRRKPKTDSPWKAPIASDR